MATRPTPSDGANAAMAASAMVVAFIRRTSVGSGAIVVPARVAAAIAQAPGCGARAESSDAAASSRTQSAS